LHYDLYFSTLYNVFRFTIKSVQDADKLDAIGAFGVLRCAAFSGARNIALFNPADAPIEGMTKEQYEQQTNNGGGSAINHFHGNMHSNFKDGLQYTYSKTQNISNITTEKLFLLKDMMRTSTGKELAEKRDQFMRNFVHQIQEEYLLNA
jgi:uncharacterized protein